MGIFLRRSSGASTQGGNGARCTMAKIGRGDVVMIMMLLLVSIIIYHYMNTSRVAQSCYSVIGDKPFLWSKPKFDLP